jgi:FKBP-type peptidyl-prolyl cis-trans isomerase
MADFDGFLSTMSGLRYKILTPSVEEPPGPNDTVTVYYRGWLKDGSEFDSSYARNEPATFALKDVIPGWTEGLQLIGPGGRIQFQIPARLGYGEEGAEGVIPPNATLYFEVELLEVVHANSEV